MKALDQTQMAESLDIQSRLKVECEIYNTNTWNAHPPMAYPKRDADHTNEELIKTR